MPDHIGNMWLAQADLNFLLKGCDTMTTNLLVHQHASAWNSSPYECDHVGLAGADYLRNAGIVYLQKLQTHLD